jgi:hypothetical protein
MSVFKKQSVVANYNAFDVVKREKTSGGFVNLNAGETLVTSEHLSIFSINSAVSYALSYNEDPVEAYNQCIELKNQAHWIVGRGASLSSHKKDKEIHIEINTDQIYRFEGQLFKIDNAPNNNLALIPIAE